MTRAPLRRAFEGLNLTRNPFGELPPNERVAVSSLALDRILEDVRAGRWVQLVGPQGRGKTTTLLALAVRLQNAHYARVLSAEHTGRWPPTPPSLPKATEVLLLDEADALPIWSRVPLLRRAPVTVLATHTDLAFSLSLAGRRARVHPIGGVPTLAWLREAVHRRILYYRRAEGPTPRVDDAHLTSLLAQHGDDLRAIERALYDHLQHLERTG